MLSKELVDFIVEYFREKKLPLDTDLILPDTDIYEDLGIHDLDIDLFMGDFTRAFEIDDSKFESKKYFGLGLPIIDNNVGTIERIIGARSWLPLDKEKRERFTLKVLDNAIKTKTLV